MRQIILEVNKWGTHTAYEDTILSLRSEIIEDLKDDLGWHKYHDILVELRYVGAGELPPALVSKIKYDPDINKVIDLTES